MLADGHELGGASSSFARDECDDPLDLVPAARLLGPYLLVSIVLALLPLDS